MYIQIYGEKEGYQYTFTYIEICMYIYMCVNTDGHSFAIMGKGCGIWA